MLRIKSICKEKNIKLNALAKRLGITYHSLHAIMTGNPQLATLKKVAEALEVTVRDLFVEENEVSIDINYADFTTRLTIKDLIQISQLSSTDDNQHCFKKEEMDEEFEEEELDE